MSLGDLAVFCLFSIALRWLVFRHHAFKFFQDFLKNAKSPIFRELSGCCYCQTVEAGIVSACLLASVGDLPFSVVQAALAVLVAGLAGTLTESWIEKIFASVKE